MLKNIRDYLAGRLSEEDQKRIDQTPLKLNSVGVDPWGLNPSTAKAFLTSVKWLYTHYFRTDVRGIDNLPSGRVILVANHGGQIPIDGLLIGLSVLLEGKHPRIVRGMVDRWVPTMPFISAFFTQIGQVVGDPKNCKDLLEQQECILVFPEGTKGSGKPISKRYQLQRFGSGFIRLALETRSPIVPVSVIGSEEAFPAIYHSKLLAKLINAPYFPITPLFPLLGPVGALPLPTKVQIRFSKPIYFDGDPDLPSADILPMVRKVKREIQRELLEGLRERGGNIFSDPQNKKRDST